MEKRSIGCTAMNEQSSRSHMVFTLRIDGTNASSQLKVRARRPRAVASRQARCGWLAAAVLRRRLCLCRVNAPSLPRKRLPPSPKGRRRAQSD
jgi:hypothetical protein